MSSVQTTSRKGQSFCSSKNKPSNDYLAGFVDGEGCFYVGVFKKPDTKFGWQVMIEFRVSQNPKGKYILDLLKKRLGCGKIRPNDSRQNNDKSLVFVIRRHQALWNKVVPFFDRYRLWSGKKKDYQKFKKALEIVHNKEHSTKDGFKQILDLAYSMNSKQRKRSKQDILASIK